VLSYISDKISLKVFHTKCIGCGMCVIVCPHQLFVIEDKKAMVTNKSLCIECGACKSNCPVGAIEVDAGTGCAVAVLNTK